MRILVEILHPAHVHVFRNAIAEFEARGDEVLVLSREKDVANQLLDAYQIPYLSISRLGASKWSLLQEMLVRDFRMLRAALSFRPDVLIGIMGVTIVQVGLLLRKPAVVFYDTENATITNRIVYPLAHTVCTPECYSAPVQGKHVTYPGYHELAYLHPNRFTADARVVESSGVDPKTPYFILRFVSWQASHDLGERGFGLNMKRRFVEGLRERGRVLISSEGPLPADLEELRFSAPPEQMHHFLAHARLLVGESATMASEAAMLGVPAFYIADTGRGYTDELETRYGLVQNFSLSEASTALTQALSGLDDAAFLPSFQSRHEQMLREHIDVTSWMVQTIDRIVSDAG